MYPISILAVIGMVLGAVLVLFSLLNRSKLPGWGAVLFPIIGGLIIVSGILLYLGASAL